jgi:hypothetical protein
MLILQHRPAFITSGQVIETFFLLSLEDGKHLLANRDSFLAKILWQQAWNLSKMRVFHAKRILQVAKYHGVWNTNGLSE